MLDNIIFISSDDPIIRPENARDPGLQEYKQFAPAFNCSVVSNDPTKGVSAAAAASACNTAACQQRGQVEDAVPRRQPSSRRHGPPM